MNKEWEEYVWKRCQYALTNNKEYMSLQEQLATARKNNDLEKYGEISVCLQSIVEKVCYKAGAEDIKDIIK